MTESQLAERLMILLDSLASDEEGREFLEEAGLENIQNTSSFESAGLLTMNNGIVLQMEDGEEYQLQIVKSR